MKGRIRPQGSRRRRRARRNTSYKCAIHSYSIFFLPHTARVRADRYLRHVYMESVKYTETHLGCTVTISRAWFSPCQHCEEHFVPTLNHFQKLLVTSCNCTWTELHQNILTFFPFDRLVLEDSPCTWFLFYVMVRLS